MNLILKKFIPPILITLLKFIYRRIQIFLFRKKPIYDQRIFYHYNELNKLKFNNEVWKSENWIKDKNLESDFHNEIKFHEKTIIKSCLILSLLKFEQIHVIDFGGGIGSLIYHLLKFKDKNNINLTITLIENNENLVLAQKKYAKEKNINFIDYNQNFYPSFFGIRKLHNCAIILNFASVIQYIPNYQSYLKSLLEEINPNIVCITRFIRCENAKHDAYAIQNISTSFGFCGSTIVNLFGKNSLVETMKNLNYHILSEETKGSASHYFINCDDKRYRELTELDYTFIKN